jgi:DNA polymerase-4
LSAPTALAAKIFAAARELLKREADGTKFRLIGVGVSDLAAAGHVDRGDLIDVSGAREAAAEHAVDRVRAKFGRAAIVKGLVFEGED